MHFSGEWMSGEIDKYPQRLCCAAEKGKIAAEIDICAAEIDSYILCLSIDVALL